MVRAEWSIFEEDYWSIVNALEDLLKSAHANHILLIDRTGQLIAQAGGAVEFDVVDEQNIRIWSNSDGSDHLDFRMENAQRLRFRVKVPDTDAAILHEGCVSIVIGSKE